jgi:hypothetical protein
MSKIELSVDGKGLGSVTIDGKPVDNVKSVVIVARAGHATKAILTVIARDGAKATALDPEVVTVDSA